MSYDLHRRYTTIAIGHRRTQHPGHNDDMSMHRLAYQHDTCMRLPANNSAEPLGDAAIQPPTTLSTQHRLKGQRAMIHW